MAQQPLAERLRPQSLDDYIGQKHLVGENGVFRKFIASGSVPSFILWGPPGVGKTTLAKIVATALNRPFYTLSAVTSGVKDVREVIEKAKNQHLFNSRSAFLFIDEIHRFSKSQQDSLLGAVEEGTITLIGATTENPSFEVITPLLSRCQVYVLKHLEKADLLELLDRALTKDEHLRSLNIELRETESMLRYSGGDARKLLNIIELVTNAGVNILDNETVTKQLQQNPVAYDKDGELHYDIISAFIKSIRGSDPDAALYWLARMVAAGEDPKFIARRLCILAAEDIGLAYPQIIPIVHACVEMALKLGMPEARIPLGDAAVLMATSPKSNTGHVALDAALEDVRKGRGGNFPRHLQNMHADTYTQEREQGYRYPHNYPNRWVKQQYLPDELVGTQYYTYGENKLEQAAKQYWDAVKGDV